ncbi:TRAFAC clade GTPase domain-containing protein [Tunturiibacter lichenicola]|uniref:TRAFAC clade GTPase domain-containing protein n=1 Tax=Tunturiibacter lichenicola TaxID=2051959 RepID=UPI003D9B1702
MPAVVPQEETTESIRDDQTVPIIAVGRRFHQGIELGADDAVEIMCARYTHLIGVLGSTDAGKTCLLSSLYLMATDGMLPASYQFAGSLTLQAFEDRARGLRKWEKGALPSQLVDHTVLAHPRQPSLLHLAIQEKTTNRRRVDLLLTDLPGEWTDNLVLRAAVAPSFEFLRRADGIIIVVDGKLLVSDRQFVEVQRVRQFIERLSTNVGIGRHVPFVLLVSKSDEIAMQMPAGAIELKEYIESLGYRARVVSAAAFSRTPKEVKSGTGVFEAIEILINSKSIAQDGSIHPATSPDRSFQRFKS